MFKGRRIGCKEKRECNRRVVECKLRMLECEREKDYMLKKEKQV